MSLTNFQTIGLENVPDQVKEDIASLAMKMGESIFPHVQQNDPNIVVNAMVYAYVGILSKLVKREKKSLIDAASLVAMSIMQNMEVLISQLENENETKSE